MNEQERNSNPSTGSIMCGYADADGNLYGCGGEKRNNTHAIVVKNKSDLVRALKSILIMGILMITLMVLSH